MDLFTPTNPEIQKTRERDACAHARGRDGVAEVLALVEGMAARKCSARQIVEAVRAFEAERTQAPQSVTAQVWVRYGSPEWNAWSAFYRTTKGKTPPQDKRGGWRFPSRFPPARPGDRTTHPCKLSSRPDLARSPGRKTPSTADGPARAFC